MIGKRILRIVYFTENGGNVAKKLSQGLASFITETKPDNMNLSDWTKESFILHTPILFIGATGIADRKSVV